LFCFYVILKIIQVVEMNCYIVYRRCSNGWSNWYITVIPIISSLKASNLIYATYTVMHLVVLISQPTRRREFMISGIEKNCDFFRNFAKCGTREFKVMYSNPTRILLPCCWYGCGCGTRQCRLNTGISIKIFVSV